MGRAIAERFAAEGAAVAALHVSEKGLQETIALIVDAGGRAKGVVMDISKADAVEKTAAQVIAEFGRVTTLVNNAGIFDDHRPLGETDEALWDRIIAVDLKGVYLLSRALLPALQASGNGAIVNMASIASVVGRGGGLAYTAAKAGALTHRLAG